MREFSCLCRDCNSDIKMTRQPIDTFVDSSIPRDVTCRMKRADHWCQPQQQRSHRWSGCDRLVQMQNIKSLVVDRADSSQRSRRVWRKWSRRTVGSSRQAIAKWCHKRLGRWTITWAKHSCFVTHAAQLSRQTQNLSLYPAWNRQTIRTDQTDP